MIRRPPRSTLSSSSAASDVYKRQMLRLCPLMRPRDRERNSTPPYVIKRSDYADYEAKLKHSADKFLFYTDPGQGRVARKAPATAPVTSGMRGSGKLRRTALQQVLKKVTAIEREVHTAREQRKAMDDELQNVLTQLKEDE
eukprot:TRINITY_DN28340_c0_g1_i3.p1 TRINITY_DN28340_c0_g1~~TRINITY_DN28340_c0_g1_i3.p1  ORF type:complete len:141 (+),score=41.40 TRINITY_DN28340_c0_g1_i3:85-507(+)